MGVHLTLSAEHLARDQVVWGCPVGSWVDAAGSGRGNRHASEATGLQGDSYPVLGAIMTFGYLVERRSPLSHSHLELAAHQSSAAGCWGRSLWPGSASRSATVEQRL